MSKDLPLRLEAGVVGIEAVEYRDAALDDDHWTERSPIAAPVASLTDPPGQR